MSITGITLTSVTGSARVWLARSLSSAYLLIVLLGLHERDRLRAAGFDRLDRVHHQTVRRLRPGSEKDLSILAAGQRVLERAHELSRVVVLLPAEGQAAPVQADDEHELRLRREKRVDGRRGRRRIL